MTIAVKISVDAKEVVKYFDRLGISVPKEIKRATFSYADYLANRLREEALNDKRPTTSNRVNAAMKIKAARSPKGAKVVMPDSLIKLDGMNPHYVSLKRGRAITRWARKNFNGTKVSGRSNVYHGVRGGIIYEKGRRSALFVTPHRFIHETIARERNKLNNELRKGINKAIKT